MYQDFNNRHYKFYTVTVCKSQLAVFKTNLLTYDLSLPYRFQSEKETGDRNFAIGYYLKEKKVSYVGLSVSSQGMLCAMTWLFGSCAGFLAKASVVFGLVG